MLFERTRHWFKAMLSYLRVENRCLYVVATFLSLGVVYFTKKLFSAIIPKREELKPIDFDTKGATSHDSEITSDLKEASHTITKCKADQMELSSRTSENSCDVLDSPVTGQEQEKASINVSSSDNQILSSESPVPHNDNLFSETSKSELDSFTSDISTCELQVLSSGVSMPELNDLNSKISMSELEILLPTPEIEPSETLRTENKVLVSNTPTSEQEILLSNTPTSEQEILLSNTPTSESEILLSNTPTTDQEILLSNTPTTEQEILLSNTPTTEQEILLSNTPTTEQEILLSNTPTSEEKILLSMSLTSEHEMLHSGDITSLSAVSSATFLPEVKNVSVPLVSAEILTSSLKRLKQEIDKRPVEEKNIILSNGLLEKANESLSLMNSNADEFPLDTIPLEMIYNILPKSMR